MFTGKRHSQVEITPGAAKPDPSGSACSGELARLRSKWATRLNNEAHLAANPGREQDRDGHFLAVGLIESFLRDLSRLEQAR